MSFGSGIGDIIAITQLAWTVWSGYQKAPKEFKDICGEIHRFATTLEGAPPSWPDAQTQDRFQRIVLGCKELLEELNKILEQNQSLADSKGSKLDRLMWGEDLGALRMRIVTNISSLTNFYTSQHLYSLHRIEQELGKYKIDSSKMTVPHTITPPLSPRADSAPAGSHWEPPATPPPYPERAQTLQASPSTKRPSFSGRTSIPSNKKPTLTAKLYSFTHSRQDLLEAIDQENLALVQQLVHDYGRDVNHASIDRNGETPLTLAAALGHTDIVRWLVDNGADFERRNHFGFSPLAAAARLGKHRVVGLLLERGADTEAKDKAFRATVLQLAVEAGAVAVESVRLLLEAGADVHATNYAGREVVHYLQNTLSPGVRQQLMFMLKDYGVSMPRKSSRGSGATPPPPYEGYRGSAPVSPSQDVDSWYTSVPYWKRFGRNSRPQSLGNKYEGHHWASMSHPVPDGYGLSNAATTSW